MRVTTRPRWVMLGLFSAALSNSWAQQSPTAAPPATPAHEAPRPDQLEPGVDTSATAAPAPGAASTGATTSAAGSGSSHATAPESAAVPATTDAAGRATRSNSTRPSRQKAGSASQAGSPPQPGSPPKPGAPAPKPGASAGKAHDRIELDTTQITGNRELPKVLYIVPWKRSDLGDLVGKPVNSLLDEVLAPVDRDVFKRENRYYEALKPDEGKPAAGAVQGSGDKR